MKKKYIIGIVLAIIICACAVAFIIVFKANEPVREAKKLAEKIKNNASVFLDYGLTDKEIENIKRELEKIDGVVILKYTSKEEALEDAKVKLGENGDLLDTYTSGNHPFPASFKIDIDKKVDFDQCIKKIKNIKNVKDVKYFENRDKLYLLIMREGIEKYKDN
ncbi:MAG: permease-like cell division protein FtsX [Clostridia bacterium]|nr:permease-like cell division protein FtsX [Clostridia bacterium]